MSKTSPLANRSGFTLIEMLVTIAIFSLLSLGIYSLVAAVLTSSSKQSALLSGNDQARRAVADLVEELRNAQASATGSYALATVDDQELVFYSKTTGSTVDRIHYYLDNGQMKKGITAPSGDPPVYDLDNETVTTVQDDVGNGANPLFYYYDGSYDGVTGTALAQPVNITQVRFVQVNLSIYNKAGSAGTNTYTVTGGATIRGLKTNLGDS
jgi:prepilin-type N-terminal cleavage/methylation domain-containing protein